MHYIYCNIYYAAASRSKETISDIPILPCFADHEVVMENQDLWHELADNGGTITDYDDSDSSESGQCGYLV